ncbi:hypothetical protein LCGC14_1767310 [marine sediment metagenome]|uniref:Uncharacterized protein n=1 Tax=marine sediment metagenome TaxID=412755 RepID=A0A0F9JE36_9ZZZZ
MGERIVVDTHFAIGEVVRVRDDVPAVNAWGYPNYIGRKFRVEEIVIDWSYPHGNRWIQYRVLLDNKIIRAFDESRLEKCADNMAETPAQARRRRA